MVARKKEGLVNSLRYCQKSRVAVQGCILCWQTSWNRSKEMDRLVLIIFVVPVQDEDVGVAWNIS